MIESSRAMRTAAALLALAGCRANLVVRNAAVTWNDSTKVASAEIANVGRRGASAFPVYFDGEEDPVSANHRPQVRKDVATLPAGAAVTLTADFAPLAHPDNASLGNVRAVRITADPKNAIRESREDDNVAMVAVPGMPDCSPATSDVASGTTGTIMIGQSFNETRAVRLTVLGSSGRIVEKLVLRGLNVWAPTGTVGGRIYDDATQALVGTADVTVGEGADQTVEVPISATLSAGKAYRIGFYVATAPLWAGTGSFFIPSGFTSPSSQTPYAESSGVFRVESAHAVGADAFPANPNMAVVQMTVTTRCP